jgi:hypothetical protein
LAELIIPRKKLAVLDDEPDNHILIVQTRNTLGIAEPFYRKGGFGLCYPGSRQLYLPLGAKQRTSSIGWEA